jgi:hypothetical protein
VTSFERVARGHARLLKEYPIFELQFNAFSIYAGELKAESRQLEALEPPRPCSDVQKSTVRLLRRDYEVSKALGEAKNLTPWEFKHGGEELSKLPPRLAAAIEEAAQC